MRRPKTEGTALPGNEPHEQRKLQVLSLGGAALRIPNSAKSVEDETVPQSFRSHHPSTVPT